MTNMLRRAAPCLCLGGLVLYYFLSSPTGGDFWWYDAPRHAMNGVFLSDLLSEGGLAHPLRYARAYYEQYPAINIGFYPPFFYLSSVPLLLLFGASHAVAQAAVALYTLMLGALVCLICRRAMDHASALATALCVLLLAPVALWSRQVQLDVPAAAMHFLTAGLLIRHLETQRQGWLFAAAVCLGLSMLTRVQGVFAVPVFLFFVFGRGGAGRPALGKRIAATAIAGLIALPAMLMVAYFSKVNQALATAAPGMPPLWSLANWTWYAGQLPLQLGWPALCLAVAGLAAAARAAATGRATPALRVLAAYTVCAWIFFSVVSNKDPRFNLPGMLFLFVLAAHGLYLCAAPAARLFLPALAAWLLLQLGATPAVPVVGGFPEAAAAAQALTPQQANVLISAHRDGNFIYALRTLGRRRDIGVCRADKLFVEIHIMRELGVRDRNLDRQAILAMLDRHKVATVVAQPGYLSDQPSMRNFQALLDDGVHYARVRTVALTGQTGRDERALVIYQRRRGL
ncbi:ArnT family glycosyltransferase [Janthinobacterium fluminis]|uniref:Glycosyltransferase family 39 protein n=1 Tax=Janthinobacterium fluminis TaxID=2987524 RepID=A0ABT5K441_9BURK|nr:glycosyltransferase family 39 protein [Janthinobacterium fluminis]MDC8759659.1 glycosyltransferase family 39 protein [Janthinobacterium fluminis]